MKKGLSANGYKKWSFEMPQQEKAADPSHSGTQGDRVYPVCITLWGGGIRASPTSVPGRQIGILPQAIQYPQILVGNTQR